MIELTGKKAPQTGLEGKFSVYHAVAAAMVYGRVGEAEFSDQTVRDPAVLQLRERISATVDRSIAEDQVRLTVVQKDGGQAERFVEHAVGSAKNPMSNSQLEAKLKGLADPILPADRVKRLIDFCWNLEKAPDAGQLPRMASA